MLELCQKSDLELRQEIPAKTILIVDDEAVIRDLCKRALKGYNVVEAGGGEAALSLFAKGGIDVILTDVMMPGMDGIELLKRLKEKEPTIVVIVMTGFAEKDVILNALKADADDFISKPLNLLQLKTAVDKALIKKALKEEIASLKSLDRLKSNFLSTISHKFRTPITSISLFLQNLASGTYTAEDPDFKMNVRLISDESAYLERLVADLLVFSRVMDTGEGLKKEPVYLAKAIHKILAESREIATKPAIEAVLDLDAKVVIHADREKITFALKQIIDNAYKFSGEEGEVGISLRQDAERLMLTVSDTGSGIAADEIPKVFEKFYQIDPHNTGQVRGFGLGLFYAREFIRMHGGSITVQSTSGMGSKFSVLLPLHSA
ncbi:MAG: hybrid sensor histidine kinase/response regulator [Geobacter sp.]|nr:hybrid sensor histidine kinase/response regulator [Geobacter sp.]